MTITGEETRPVPANEIQRLINLSDFDQDYSNMKDNFKDLTELAARITGTNISLVNLVDSYTQWSVSNHGLDIEQMPREESVCQYTIMEDDYFEIADLAADNRTKDFSYVKKPLNLRYYFGVPLKSAEGHNIGALCVLDPSLQKLTPEKIVLLKLIANEVVNRLSNMKILQDLKSELDEAKKIQRKTAHDIRGSLSGIAGIIEIIRKRGEKDKIADVLDYINMIDKSAKTVLLLVDEILAREKTLKSEQFNLCIFKERLERLYNPQAKAKNIFFKISIGKINQYASFPKRKLLQIAGNLISNALKFSSNYGTVTVKLDLDILGKQKTLKIDISDNGNGLNHETVQAILSGKPKSADDITQIKGYGFGLPMVKEDIERLNGEMHITSEEGWGTNFEVLIPAS